MSGTRRAGSMAAAVALILMTGAGSAIAGVDPGAEDGAAALKTGWWWAANADATSDTDVNPGEVPKPGVPAGSLPVTQVAGEQEKVAAIEFMVDGNPGGSVTSLLLSLREAAPKEPSPDSPPSEPPALNVGSDPIPVGVAACQIKDAFWADSDGAAWDRKPDYDAKNCAEGKRGKTGVWQFDLTPIAQAWTTDGTDPAPSVLLVPQVEEPSSFQVVFEGLNAGGIGVQGTSKGGTPLATTPLPPAGGTAVPPGDVPVSGDSGAVSGGDLGAVDAPAPEIGDAPAPADAPPVGGAEPGQGDAELAASPAVEPPGLFGGIPAGVWFLIPLALGLAYLLMVSMGPRAEAAGGGIRHGVSRALERMRTTGAATKGIS